MQTLDKILNATFWTAAALTAGAFVYNVISSYNFTDNPEVLGITAVLAVLVAALCIHSTDFT